MRQGAEPKGNPGGQQGSGRVVGTVRAGPRAEEIGGPADDGAQELMLQEDEVDWGGSGKGLGDPVLQHALAVIRAKGDQGERQGRLVGGRGGVYICTSF